MLKRNLVANFVGQFVGVATGIAFVPVYVRYLGVEAYGVIGFFAMLQSWLALLDVGLGPTLVREMARLRGGAHSPESARDLLRSIEVAGGVTGLVAASAVVALAPFAADRWLRPEALSTSELIHSIRIMALVIGLRFIESLHRSALLGLERQVFANLVSAALLLFRAVGALGVLAWISPTLEAFFWWQLAMSVVSLVAIAISTYVALPAASRGARASISSLRGVWAYAGQMSIGAALGFCLSQIDKVVLSRMLSLEEYGRYFIAVTAASGVTLLLGPIAQAYFPRLCQLHASGNDREFARVFHLGSQAVCVIAGTAGIMLAARSTELLFAWTGDPELATRIGLVTSLLAAANVLNAATWMLYQAQLAHGWLRFGVIFNGVAVLVVVPAMIFAVSGHGLLGAAAIWLAVNFVIITVAPPIACRKVLVGEYRRWLVGDVVIPLGASLLTVVALGLVPRSVDQTRFDVLLRCAAEGMVASAVAFATCRELRKASIALLRADRFWR